jgi:predicted enzyme related to lactoylglutathione lyase
MSLRLAHVTLDCDDPQVVAAFWSAALDRPIEAEPSEFFVSIGIAGDDGPAWFFIKVPEPKTAKNRMHVDLEADDREKEITRLLELGATRGADHDEYGVAWTVMADPEGNEFCIAGP